MLIKMLSVNNFLQILERVPGIQFIMVEVEDVPAPDQLISM